MVFSSSKKHHPDEWTVLFVIARQESEQFSADDGGIHLRRDGDEGNFLA